MTTAAEVLAIARAEIGYVESGGYDGRSGNITKYWAEIAPSLQGQPWCAGFMDWCFRHAGLPFPSLYTYVPNLTAYAKKVGRLFSTPEVGDIAIYWHGEHTGIVEIVLPNENFAAIEGNTSPTSAGSQSNGGGVYRKTRNVSDAPDGFYRPPYEGAAPAPSQEDQLFSTSPANTFHLIASHSGLLLEAGGVGNNNGAAVCQSPSDGGLDQRWQEVGHADGSVSFVNRYGKALDVPNGDAQPGAALRIWDANYSAAQRFIPKGTGIADMLVHAASGLVVDIAYLSLDAGAPAVLWHPTAAGNQVFVLARCV